ncbi:hypothetical protein FAZ19_17025 [Sphingobacterium alkalisoli]|uniref:SGNH hydrolase-type esterase domain-containing protein n=1 Tax=Sphingobacterium alkalisoli TaxID=1874115 RepID=A0A4V6WF39_9SPHI|nr:GDSL-type esterase/lipase family protein [Sphingobacterium alkalisoli]TJY63959.1 hypothetical protein FAZ19_17025 [Sphingobacterium alkalisoli]GGH23787.1 lysophospholipase [Sphingobacterium alkalisoli]
MKQLIYLTQILYWIGILAPSSTHAQVKLTQRQKWEQKLERYARLDSLTPPPKDVNLFVGSSTIENWKTLSDDFPDQIVLNRGVSGTKTIDLYEFKDRLIDPYEPKQIFIYEGDNDIGLGWKTDAIVDQFKQLVEEVRLSKPDARIVFIAVKPSPRRLKDRIQVEEVNARIRTYLEARPNTGYADVYNPMLTADGQLIPRYYQDDGLHLTAAGYAVWKKVIEKFLEY